MALGTVADEVGSVNEGGHLNVAKPKEAKPTTLKTKLVIFILSSTSGLSFWPVPTTSAMQDRLAVIFGDNTSYVWFVPAYTTANSISFILAGANSDLFGRRLILIIGNAVCCIGFIVTATATSSAQFTAGLGLTGFGAGFCQMAMCAIPELLPNKFRHIGVCLSDGFVFAIVIIGPIIGRCAVDAGPQAWQYVYWSGFVLQFISLCGVLSLYHPPKHPRGVSWASVFRGLDYVGALLVIPGICLTLVGIVNTTYKPRTDVTVIVPLCAGFGVLILFGLWESFSSVKYPLCPPRIFRSHNGREFTLPFILAFIVTMFYYGINITYPTMVDVFYVSAQTSRTEELALSLPGNLGLVFGALMLSAFGHHIGHWRWTLTLSWIGMSVFGGLLAIVTPNNKCTMIAFAFLEQMFFGWAQYESIVFTQLGVKQMDLGISGGLAGVARYAGGSLAQAIYTSILTNTQTTRARITVPAAAVKLGLGDKEAQQILEAFISGSTKSVWEVPGVTDRIFAAASESFKWSYVHGLRVTTLSSLAFAGLGLACCLLCENIDAKMNSQTEVFLENDVNAEKNRFH